MALSLKSTHLGPMTNGLAAGPGTGIYRDEEEQLECRVTQTREDSVPDTLRDMMIRTICGDEHREVQGPAFPHGTFVKT